MHRLPQQAQYGLLVSYGFALLYTAFSFPAGYACDRFPRTRLLLATQSLLRSDNTQAASHAWQTVAVVLQASDSAAPLLCGTHLALALAQQLAGHMKPPRVLMLTCGVLALGGAPSAAAHGGAWGFARVLRLEHAALRTRSIDVSRGASTLASSALPGATSEDEAAQRGDAHCVARLRACTAASDATASPRV